MGGSSSKANKTPKSTPTSTPRTSPRSSVSSVAPYSTVSLATQRVAPQSPDPGQHYVNPYPNEPFRMGASGGANRPVSSIKRPAPPIPSTTSSRPASTKSATPDSLHINESANRPVVRVQETPHRIAPSTRISTSAAARKPATKAHETPKPAATSTRSSQLPTHAATAAACPIRPDESRSKSQDRPAPSLPKFTEVVPCPDEVKLEEIRRPDLTDLPPEYSMEDPYPYGAAALPSNEVPVSEEFASKLSKYREKTAECERKWARTRSPRSTVDYTVSEDTIVRVNPDKEEHLEQLLEKLGQSEQWDTSEMNALKKELEKNHGKNRMRQYARDGRVSVEEAISAEGRRDLQLVNQPAVNKHLRYKSLVKAKQMNKTAVGKKKNLPIFAEKDTILKLIQENQTVLISGETGCGKTTQVPQYILDSELSRGRGSLCRILCTQPRRISAVSIAQRVANERGEQLGHKFCSVGYQVRFEKKKPRKLGSIMYTTSGVALSHMRLNPLLYGYSHIILDEVHERTTDTDFLMAALLEILPLRDDLKLIIMSATMDIESLQSYFGPSPYFHVPGTTFDIKTFYMEDILPMMKFLPDLGPEDRKKPHYRWLKKNKTKEYKADLEKYLKNCSLSTDQKQFLRNPASEKLHMGLIVQLVLEIHRTKGDGAILVFLPSWDTITDFIEKLKGDNHRMNVIPLHAQMAMMDQKEIFSPAKEGVRKVVVSTNLAETSITIEDVVYIVDSGRSNVRYFDSRRNVMRLDLEWEAAANAKQRQGRAGRVRNGECYKLFTRPRERLFEARIMPEIIRSPLEDIVLRVKSLNLGDPISFLGTLMNAPEEIVVRNATETLQAISALNGEEAMTPLGLVLSQMPTQPRLGKMIIYGILLGCLDPILTVVAVLDSKDPFQLPRWKNKEDRKNKESELKQIRSLFAKDSDSDHIMFVNAIHEWIDVYEACEKREAEMRRSDFRYGNPWAPMDTFLKEKFLKYEKLDEIYKIRCQLVEHLFTSKLIPNKNPKHEKVNTNAHCTDMVRTAICAGLFPNVLPRTQVEWNSNPHKNPEQLFPHPKSVLSGVSSGPDFQWIAYWLLLDTTRPFLHDISGVNPSSICLTAGGYKPHEEDGKPRKTGAGTKFRLADLHKNGDLLLKIPIERDFYTKIRTLRDALDNLTNHVLTSSRQLQWTPGSREFTIREAVVAATFSG